MITVAKIRIFGYVGKDPLSPSANNPNFITFPVSVNDQDKNKEKITTWYECQASNEKIAELIRKQVKKGVFVSIEGTPRLEAYIDKNNKAIPTCKIYISGYRDIIPFVATSAKNETANDIYPNTNENTFDDDSIPF